MAISKALISSLLLCLIILHIAEADDHMMSTSGEGEGSPHPPQKIDCEAACSVRCKLSSRQNLCKRACGTCCARCNCVPPGTYGNHEVCPCYANLTTRGNKRKCP